MGIVVDIDQDIIVDVGQTVKSKLNEGFGFGIMYLSRKQRAKSMPLFYRIIRQGQGKLFYLTS